MHPPDGGWQGMRARAPVMSGKRRQQESPAASRKMKKKVKDGCPCSSENGSKTKVENQDELIRENDERQNDETIKTNDKRS